jgi:isoleucyl-tRNA synthetase
VHLGAWIDRSAAESDCGNVLSGMEQVRNLVTLGLEARQKANIKVRQPLAKLFVPKHNLQNEYLGILKDELNVKEITVDESLLEGQVVLDAEITDELRDEGDMRELVRKIQDMRKEIGLEPKDRVKVSLSGDEPAWFEKFKREIMETVGAERVSWGGENGVEKV